MLGLRDHPFLHEDGLRLASDGMKMDGLEERGIERLADGSDHRVEGPNVERLLRLLLELLHVAERPGHLAQRAKLARADRRRVDDRVGRRMLAVLREPPRRIEDL